MFSRTLTRSLVRRPWRFALAVAAVALGVGMTVALAAISLSLGDRLGSAVRAYGANLVLAPRGADLPLEVAGQDLSALVGTSAGTFPESSLASLGAFRWRNNILGVAPQAYAVGAVGNLRVAVIGTWFTRSLVNAEGDTLHAGMTTIAPWWSVEGAYPPDEATDTLEAPMLVGRRLAARLGPLGATHALALEGAPTPLAVRVVGVLDAGGFEDDHLYLPLAALQRATGTQGQVAKALVSALVVPGNAPPMPDPARDLAAYERWSCRPYALTVGREIEGAMPGVTAHPIAGLVRGEDRVVGRLNLLFLLLAGAALTAAVLGVTSTMIASVVDRGGEIALLRALGASRGGVARLFLGEALVVSLVGGVLGVGLGALLARLIGQGAFGAAIAIQPPLIPAALVLAAAVCLLGAWMPVRRAGAIDPATTLRAGA